MLTRSCLDGHGARSLDAQAPATSTVTLMTRLLWRMIMTRSGRLSIFSEFRLRIRWHRVCLT